ncbi:hypothetical protein MMC22_004861 [Lobaria immixta]|nr:hypothetical protein [Lobaria immixta]
MTDRLVVKSDKDLGIVTSMVIMAGMDILTDLLIILIPIYLLKQVQIKLRQKLVIGTSLCLSIMMVITAVIRISSVRGGHNNLDIIWWIFWLFSESCISIVMVSLIAFRSLFVMHKIQREERKRRDLAWKQRRERRLQRNWENDSGDEGSPENSDVVLAEIKGTVEGAERQSSAKPQENKVVEDQNSCVLQDGRETSEHSSTTEEVSRAFSFIIDGAGEYSMTILNFISRPRLYSR